MKSLIKVITGAALGGLLFGALPFIAAASAPTTSGPTISQSSGGLALVADNAPTATTATAPATPGIPNTGADQTAAASTNIGIADWVWLVLAGLVLIGVGIWAIRQPVGTD